MTLQRSCCCINLVHPVASNLIIQMVPSFPTGRVGQDGNQWLRQPPTSCNVVSKFCSFLFWGRSQELGSTLLATLVWGEVKKGQAKNTAKFLNFLNVVYFDWVFIWFWSLNDFQSSCKTVLVRRLFLWCFHVRSVILELCYSPSYWHMRLLFLLLEIISQVMLFLFACCLLTAFSEMT